VKILITGGCGFVGHHFVENFIKSTSFKIVVLDKLGYASCGYDRLRDIGCYDHGRISTFSCDLAQGINEGLAREIGEVDYVIHMAAESHVERSIQDPEPFVRSNVLGTMYLLNFCRQFQKNARRIVYFSTDEVFGPAPEGVAFKEWDNYNCTNPYSASKAGGEELALAYANTYKMPIIVTHTVNIYGERQHPEKFIPLAIRKILAGETLILHSNPERTKSASRFWIHARSAATAVDFLLERSEIREKYNVTDNVEMEVLKVAQLIAKILGKELKYELVDFHSSRPGHDPRYSLDGTKLKDMGWRPVYTFEQSLEKTIRWMTRKENLRWLE